MNTDNTMDIAVALLELSNHRHNKSQISKKHENSNKIKLGRYDILRVLMYPQPVAAKELGVSISTLKRRYYELGMTRWPVANAVYESDAEMPARKTKQSNKLELSFILNKKNTEPRTRLDAITNKMLQCVFDNKGE
jgi:hypothetical protein